MSDRTDYADAAAATAVMLFVSLFPDPAWAHHEFGPGACLFAWWLVVAIGYGADIWIRGRSRSRRDDSPRNTSAMRLRRSEAL